MSVPSKWLPVFLLLVHLSLSYAGFEFDHSVDTDEYTLRSKGKLKKIIELNYETTVKVV